MTPKDSHSATDAPVPTPGPRDPAAGEPQLSDPATEASEPMMAVRKEEAGESEPSVARRRLREAFLRPVGVGSLLAALLLCLLGFAVSTQLRAARASGLAALSQGDLVAVLDSVNQESTRLDQQITRLQRTRDQLAGSGSDAAAEAAAKQQLTDAQVLAGTVAVTGPGAVITLRGSADAVPVTTLLDAVQELRDAGAEAIDINGVRVVASTSFVAADGGIQVGGKVTRSPYVITAIGESATLTSAMEIPGGVAETVRGAGGTIALTAQPKATITSTHTPAALRHASPVAPSSPPSSSAG